jgi:cell division septal protein FtsQ
MEFRPRSNTRQESSPNPVLPPEKNLRASKKKTQKLHKSYNTRRRIAGALKFLAKLCVLIFATALPIGLFFFAYTSNSFAVRTVLVDGCQHVNPRKVEGIVRREFPGNLLRMNLAALRGRLEQESWVKFVEIRRVLPSELVISVQERVPSVILELQGELMVADDEAVLLDKYSGKYKIDVPVFRGLAGDGAAAYQGYQEENTARVRAGLAMLAELEAGSPAFPREISEVDVSDLENIKVLLVDDTAEIILGDKDFLRRFRRLLSNMDRYRAAKAEYGEMISVDLRVDGQIVYRPRSGVSATGRPRDVVDANAVAGKRAP